MFVTYQNYLQYILLNTSTCFGRVYSPSSGGTPYGYNNWYLLFFLDGCLLSWLGFQSQPGQQTVI